MKREESALEPTNPSCNSLVLSRENQARGACFSSSWILYTWDESEHVGHQGQRVN